VLGRVAAVVVGRRRWVLAVSGLLVVLAAVFGAGAIPQLKGGGFEDESSLSYQAKAELERLFGNTQANEVLLVTAKAGSVDDATVAADAAAAVTRLRAEPGVQVITDYWHAPATLKQGLRSTSGADALVLLHLDGDEDAVMKRAGELGPLYTTTTAATQLRTGGFGQANTDITSQVGKDLALAEGIAVPITLVLLVLVFGSVVSGTLPLLVGGMAIAATFAVLRLMSIVTPVSIFALNLTTALGLGLGIDYALLMVSRYREELANGRGVDDAVAATVRTAGRTVLFSAVTIAASLAAMLVFPLYFLRSFAYAGIAVVLVAALAAVVTLPAMLALLGRRVEALPVGSRASRARRAAAMEGLAAPGGAALESGFWWRLSNAVMRRPVVAALPVAALLVALGLPFLHVQFSNPDDRSVQADVSQARAVGDVLRNDFVGNDSSALYVVLPQTGDTQLADYTSRLAALPDVAAVAVTGRAGEAALVQVTQKVAAFSSQGEAMVAAVRAAPAPGSALVGGPSAVLVDSKDSIGRRLPFAIGIIALVTFLVLFLFTGSVVIPLKALLVNVISIGGVLGSMVWVFQDGHGSGLLDFTPLPLTLTMPILMFCVAFGLSMDYEVFLLARIRELHEAGATTAEAVGGGLARTGRIVTAAAVLLAVTMFAFTTSKVNFIQMFGLGTGLAIVIDATLVRGVLVPALMRLLGAANWWAPKPLRIVYRRFGLREAEA